LRAFKPEVHCLHRRWDYILL